MLCGKIVDDHPDAETLVVIMHGNSSSPDRLGALVEVVRGVLPDSVILRPSYWSGWLRNNLSNEDPYDFALDLALMIEEEVRRHTLRTGGVGYKRIILMGYSIGSLLVRKAYVIALGVRDDNPYGVPLGPFTWAPRVERIVLLAGMNRGYSFDRKPRNMTWRRYLPRKLFLAAARRLGIARFVRGLMRGAPFVADLRIQWIRLRACERIG
ncbi:MAG: hypothetical protein ACLQGP_04905 [Isosphaeraceae bacterium]